MASASLLAASIATAGPSTAPCPPGQGPTTISKRVSLSEAASRGAVKLTSKGGYNSDADFRGEAGEPDGNPFSKPQSGEWPSGRGEVGDRQIWTHIGEIRARPSKLAAGRRAVVKLAIILKGAGDEVRFELQRRSRGEWRRLGRPGTESLKPGRRAVKLTIPAQRPGTVRVVAIGKASSAIALLKIH